MINKFTLFSVFSLSTLVGFSSKEVFCPDLLVKPIIKMPTNIPNDSIFLSKLIKKKFLYIKNQDLSTITYNILKFEDKKGFPNRYDILSVIAIESSFNCQSVSKAKAYGCMQLHYVAWRQKYPISAFTTIPGNIQYGIKTLSYYYKHNHQNKIAALLAYNSGQTNYIHGKYEYSYVESFNKERNYFRNN